MKIPNALVRVLTPLIAGVSSMRRRAIPPQLAIMEMATGIWPAMILRAFVKSGIADRLARSPASPDEIARDLSLHAPSVRRVLRFLASYDVVRASARTFELTKIGRCAASDDSTSAADFLSYVGEPWQLMPWTQLDETVRTGKPAFDLTYGTGFFEYLKGHPEVAHFFDAAMNDVAKLHATAIAEAYDFSGASPLADIGGGSGLVLHAILSRYPKAHGILSDLPAAVEKARAQLAGLAGRVEFVAGDFFESVPAAKTYVLTHILHDWDDERSLKLLRAIGRSIEPDGHVLVAEALAEDDPNVWSAAALTDAQMLTMLTGRERTRAEYAELLHQAGFTVKRIVPTSAAESIIVCHKLSS
ncbi:MAG TPA: methyltransferase [Candidatus Rubrimentiphilum sp.]|nr:methyltransferase [Candidatus Rubrimentiphilum sp.]